MTTEQTNNDKFLDADLASDKRPLERYKEVKEQERIAHIAAEKKRTKARKMFAKFYKDLNAETAKIFEWDDVYSVAEEAQKLGFAVTNNAKLKTDRKSVVDERGL